VGIVRHNGYRLWEDGPVPRRVDGVAIGSLVIVRHGKGAR